HRECNHGSCRLSLWTEWSPCTSECGIGATQRSRKILEIGDTLGCNTALEEVKACEDRQCEGIDCVWGTWEDWSACTCTCGGGIKRRNRVIAVSPRNGGRLCAAHDKYEVSPCNTQSCDECIDGQWSMWGQWGQCSSHCLPAYRVRHRNVEQHPNSCGKPAT
ncbi:SPON1, partial [Symbiodinium necroappetens]